MTIDAYTSVVTTGRVVAGDAGEFSVLDAGVVSTGIVDSGMLVKGMVAGSEAFPGTGAVPGIEVVPGIGAVPGTEMVSGGAVPRMEVVPAIGAVPVGPFVVVLPVGIGYGLVSCGGETTDEL